MSLPFAVLEPEEAAALIENGQSIGFSGFTPAGAAKAIPVALAKRAEDEHRAGNEFSIGVLTGASTGPSLDGALAKSAAIRFRTPYQADPNLRARINSGETQFFDMHLSMLPQAVRYGFLGPLHWAVVEACDVTAGGGIVLTSSVGASPTFLRCADKVLIELNRHHPPTLLGLHDIYEPGDPPHRREIPVYSPSDRIGSPMMMVEPSRIAGVVMTDAADETGEYHAPTEQTNAIGEHVAEFLAGEMAAGRLPSYWPIQSGVGNVGNAVLGALGNHPRIPEFEMYTEVLQDSVIELLYAGKVKFASTCALTLSAKALERVYGDLQYFRKRLLMRPQEISNHPEVIRRLGLVAINTALEVDIFGNVNSTHVMGREMMNGIGGSGDFTRNAYLSIFTCASTAKAGKISSVVPLVSHMDHSEHSVQVIVTEHGIADLRKTSPHERASRIIENCAHPDFRGELHGYLQMVKGGHTPHTLSAAFAFHSQFLKTGDMRGIDWNKFAGL